MVELLVSHLAGDSSLSFLRVLEYITVRSALALVGSFLFCIAFGPRLIMFMRGLQAIQYIRKSEGEGAISLDEMHKHKGGVPTMGGLMMLAAVVLAALLFGDVRQPMLWLALFATVGNCAIGFMDDYLKVVKKNSAGLSAKKKMAGQLAVGLIFAGLYTYMFPQYVSYDLKNEASTIAFTGPQFLIFPFFKELAVNLGVFYIPFAVFVLVAMSNAVNLTDGLDGLAAGVTISSTICFALVCYLAGHSVYSDYLMMPHVRGAGELTVLLSALCGACFGFLWFNSYPAQIFMGDTGSMMLGGLLGAVALLVKQEFLLVIVGGIFVAEALSVVLQVGSYKIRKKRIFRMAPLHHHFERGGLPESKIIARFYIVSALLALAGLATLKLR